MTTSSPRAAWIASCLAWAGLAGAILAAGCAGAPPPLPPGERVIDVEAWQALPAADDPVRAWRPSEVTCAGGARVETDVFEINTGECRYVTAAQSPTQTLPAGQCLAFRFWHLELFSETAAEAYVALVAAPARGEPLPVHESRIPIPSNASSYNFDVTLPRALGSGDRLLLHVDNHGANSWRFPVIETCAAP